MASANASGARALSPATARLNAILTARFGARLGAILTALLRPLHTVYRRLRQGMLATRVFYEARVAVWIAQTLGFALRPAARALARRDYRFVWNVGDGVGHIVLELDNFLRARELGELEQRRYVLLRRASVFSVPVVRVYGNHFHRAVASTALYELVLPLLIPRSELVHDAGISRLKWQLGPNGQRVRPLPRQSYLWQLSKDEQRDAYHEYYRRRRLTPESYPLRQGEFDTAEVERLLGGKPDRLALVQVKRDRMNATALPTDPDTYRPALQRLRDEGFLVVLAGREPMPDTLRDLFDVDYAGSAAASFQNDIALFASADLAISGGSGLAWLADCMGVPYVYVNSWHLAMQVYSPRCVVVPALVHTRVGEALSFTQQIELFENAQDAGAEVFPGQTHVARNANAWEIATALDELLGLTSQWRPRSELQERYSRLPNRAGFLAQAAARVSENFLRAHSERFG